MVNNITAAYILYLAFCSGVLFLLFYSYSKLFGRFAPLLNNIPGGFLLFLAVNEVIAVPFTLFHLNYSNFLTLFITINATVIIFGLYHVYKNKPKVKLKNLKTPYVALAVLALFVTLVTSQAYAYYSGDDSFYLSLVEQNKTNQKLYSTDPTSGIERLTFPYAYRFQGWELIESGFSSTFNLTTLEVANGLIPLVVLPIVFAAFFYIYREFLKSQDAFLALGFLATIFLFGGYSARSEAAFLMTRPWQGKTILASLILPLLIFTMYKITDNLKDKQQINHILTIFVINMAAITLNPTAAILCSATIAVWALILLLKSKPLKIIAKLGVTLIPFLPIILFTFLLAEPRGGARIEIKSYIDYVLDFVGHPSYFVFWLVGLVAFYRNKVMLKHRTLFYAYPLLVLLTVANPLIFTFVSDNVTSTAYWRLFWLIPLTITLPVIAVALVNFIEGYVKKKTAVRKSILSTFAFILTFGVLVTSGTYVYARNLTITELNITREKLPKGVLEVNSYLISQPSGVVLASSYPAIYLHSLTTKHELLAARGLNLRVYYDINSEAYSLRASLLNLMNQRHVNAFPIKRFHQAIRTYGVDYLVYENDNSYIQDYVKTYKANTIYTSEEYQIVKPNYNTPDKPEIN